MAAVRPQRAADVRVAVLHRGRAAILPRIATDEELHTANSLTQTTQWTTTTIGTLLGGFSAAKFGYTAAFILNGLSFVFSAWCISRIALPAGEPRPHRGL